ncbi:MAG: thermonuclease family protein [Rhodospirillaceae bacterium]|nr:thermonuclease family protein [Rhodospirillaceae bacterium]
MTVWRRAMVLFATAAFCAVPLLGWAAELKVVDGDTLRRGPDLLRLQDIDAPETYEPRCPAELRRGKQATARLNELVRSARKVRVVESGKRDRYGRLLVTLLVDGRDVGDILIAEGLAVPWENGRRAWFKRRAHWCGR